MYFFIYTPHQKINLQRIPSGCPSVGDTIRGLDANEPVMAFFLVLLIFVTNAHYFSVCYTHNYSSLIYVSIKHIITNIYCSMNKHPNGASTGGDMFRSSSEASRNLALYLMSIISIICALLLKLPFRNVLQSNKFVKY